MRSLQKIQFACVAQDLFKFDKIRQKTNDKDPVIILYDSITVRDDQLLSPVDRCDQNTGRQIYLFKRSVNDLHAVINYDFHDLGLTLYEL